MHDLVMFSSMVPDFMLGFRSVELEPSLTGF